MTLSDSPRNWKPPFSELCRNASRTFTVTQEVRWPRFALLEATAKFAWKWLTEARAFHRTSRRRWIQEAQPEWESEGCEKEGDNLAGCWISIMGARIRR